MAFTKPHREQLRESANHFYRTGIKIDPKVKMFRKRWNAMKSRCYNSKDQAYARYGGRGITVSNRWLESFDTFYTDMASSFRTGLTLERVDNNKGYSKENCVWANAKQQSMNRRNVVKYDLNGKSLTLTDWATELGVGRSTLSQRLHVYKWPIERVLNAS